MRKRKAYKILWDDSGRMPKIDCDSWTPNREHDFQFEKIRYWFNEMRSASVDAKVAYILDDCPRTGALMCLNSVNGTWYIQPQPVQEYYKNWTVEHLLLGEDK